MFGDLPVEAEPRETRANPGFQTKLQRIGGTVTVASRSPEDLKRVIRRFAERAFSSELTEDELDVMLTNIIHEASAGIHDRLTLGDTYVAKDGSHKRIPVKAKDLAYISSIMFDKRALMRGDITSNPGAGGNQLEEIQKQLVKTIQAAKEKDVVASVPKE